MFVRLAVIVGLFWFGMQTAYAGVMDWPVVSQTANVVKCVISDSGKITTSAITHVSMFVGDTIKTVADCLSFTAGQLTGVRDPNPLHHD